MKKMNLMKVAVAVALLFAVNMEADAQFGNLLNKAKKAVKEKAEKVVDGSSTSSITSSSSVGEKQMALMRGIKAAFDPNGILNPGKVAALSE